MGSNSAMPAPTILLLSDSDILDRLILVALQDRWPTWRGQLNHPAPAAPSLVNPKLIIVALSQPTNEPVVVLHQSNLLGLVGRVPLILISPTTDPFEYWPNACIWRMDFPPDWPRLAQTVTDILKEDSRLPLTQVAP
jgi:hypothetical protein